MTSQSLSRIVLATALALGSASAMAGTKYIFVQPAKGATCSGTECQTLQAAIQVAPTGSPSNPGGAGDQAPSAEDVAQANQHIEQLWQNMYAVATTGAFSSSANGHTLADEVTPHTSLYFVFAQDQGSLIGWATDEAGTVTETRRYTATGSRSGLSTKVCEAIAAKAINGITCAGGTISGNLAVDVQAVTPLVSQGQSTYYTYTWSTVSLQELEVLVGAVGLPGYYPSNPV